ARIPINSLKVTFFQTLYPLRAPARIPINSLKVTFFQTYPPCIPFPLTPAILFSADEHLSTDTSLFWWFI
ncbi:MAG: hypothetical protein K2N44_12240, partial [Lachnospiraceae bacterium]|nr:hypothetical protein [Lachnospiraceae bacterium]